MESMKQRSRDGRYLTKTATKRRPGGNHSRGVGVNAVTLQAGDVSPPGMRGVPYS